MLEHFSSGGLDCHVVPLLFPEQPGSIKAAVAYLPAWLLPLPLLAGLKQYPNYMMGGGYVIGGEVARMLVDIHARCGGAGGGLGGLATTVMPHALVLPVCG